MAEATLHAVPEIDRDELKSRLRDGSLRLVDVLPADSYETAHIPGAISLPLATLERRAAEVLPDRSQEIAVYCAGFS